MTIIDCRQKEQSVEKLVIKIENVIIVNNQSDHSSTDKCLRVYRYRSL